jgi:hypothetical protein
MTGTVDQEDLVTMSGSQFRHLSPTIGSAVSHTRDRGQTSCPAYLWVHPLCSCWTPLVCPYAELSQTSVRATAALRTLYNPGGASHSFLCSTQKPTAPIFGS